MLFKIKSGDRILLINPQYRNYNARLFAGLNKLYDIKFLFIMKEHTYQKIPPEIDFISLNLNETGFRDFNLSAFKKYIKRLFKNDYDIILIGAEFSYTPVAFFLAKMTGKKIILAGESWHWPSHTIIQKFRKIMNRFMMKKADAMIASGKKSQKHYIHELGKEVGVFYVPKYVVPYQSKNPEKLLGKLLIKDKKIENKKIILYMSQIVKRKGLNYLIKAFSLLKKKIENVYLLIVGSGPFEEYCKKLAEVFGIRNIMFTGYVPDEDIELYYNLCNVLVLPSVFLKDYPEPNGYVLYEAMSVGKPLVVTNAVGAAPEYVQDGVNGFVVQERSVEELYEALLKILTNETLEKEMGRKSKEIHREKINFEKQCEAFKQVIEYVKGRK